jgi:hypothetical protein
MIQSGLGLTGSMADSDDFCPDPTFQIGLVRIRFRIQLFHWLSPDPDPQDSLSATVYDEIMKRIKISCDNLFNIFAVQKRFLM